MTAHGLAKGLTEKELARFEELLLERRRLLVRDFQAQEDSGAANIPDAFPGVSHLADAGADREATDLSLGRRESESSEILAIDEALERIRDGSFGHCDNCEKRIAKDRLEAIPYARLCLRCKIEEEA